MTTGKETLRLTYQPNAAQRSYASFINKVDGFGQAIAIL